MQSLLIMRDFDVVLKGEDIYNGSHLADAEVKDFEEFLLSIWVTKMKFVGRFYTWTSSHVLSKTDRTLVNPLLMTTWPQLEVVLPSFQTTHFCVLQWKGNMGSNQSPSNFSILWPNLKILLRQPKGSICQKLKDMKGSMKS